MYGNDGCDCSEPAKGSESTCICMEGLESDCTCFSECDCIECQEEIVTIYTSFG